MTQLTLESRIKAIIGEQAFTIAAQQQQIAELLEKIAEAKASHAKALARIEEFEDCLFGASSTVAATPTASQPDQAADAP